MLDLVEPAFHSVPPYARTYGPLVAEHAAGCGLVLDPEQCLVLDAMYAVRADDRWAATEVADIQGRQNGKTKTFVAAALADSFLFDDQLLIWTAHLFTTTKEAFRDVKALIDSNDDLTRRVKYIHEAQNDLSIELRSGARMLFKARVKTGGRGLSGDKVFLDEAWALGGSEIGSLFPTMSARPNPQIRYGSSAGMLTSGFLRSLRNRGRAGGDPSLAYIEWAVPTGGCATEDCTHEYGIDGCAVDDEDRWRQANPSLGRRISVEFVRDERRTLPTVEFTRERMGWWEDPPTGVDSVLLTAWDLLADADQAGTPTALAVDVAPGRMSSSVAGAIRRPDGLPQLDLLAHWPGTAGVVELLAEKSKKFGLPVLLDPTSEAGSLISALEKLGVTVVEVSGREMTQACGEFAAAVADGQLRHLGDPVLSTALAAARQTDVGDGAWRWSRTSSAADISPVVAATLALHGHLTHAGPSVYESRDLVVL